MSKKLLSRQFVHFSIVGASGVIVDYAILIFLTELLGIYYLGSSILSFVGANFSNFILNKRWTFGDRGQQIIKQYASFAVIGAIGLILNTLILYVAVENMDLHYLTGKAIAIALVLFWNFVAAKKFTFGLLSNNKNTQP